ncbi:hypothetical protein [Burkholderia pseudomallei]|uniref:hypothetical protein n=1 Tax=Burkholderia pseudomallei TaxID=28450 RepID=UPI0012F4C5D5|nr:hypothetical protein [Burkholderia pseudomallei]
MINECPRAGRWIGGCKFEARYDERPVQRVSEVVQQISRASNEAVHSIMQGNMQSAYVHDVCTRCGKVIKRETS